jgi:microcompartment protein CcmL/EutN
MENASLGLIEVLGLVGAVEAADAGSKAANVTFRGYKRGLAGLITVVFTGDVGAVRAAVAAGVAAAKRVGQVISVDVIARPHEQLQVTPNGAESAHSLAPAARRVAQAAASPERVAGEEVRPAEKAMAVAVLLPYRPEPAVASEAQHSAAAVAVVEEPVASVSLEKEICEQACQKCSELTPAPESAAASPVANARIAEAVADVAVPPARKKEKEKIRKTKFRKRS